MRNCLFLFLFFFIQNALAQKSLLFYHSEKGAFVELKIGNRASILYKGYQGQIEFVKETVTDITDSTLVLGVNYAENLPMLARKPGKNTRMVYKIIRIEDIIGFRKMGLGKQLGKLAFSTAGIIGSYFFLRSVYSSDLSPGVAFLISLGTGLSIITINNLIFPENIQHYFDQGWQVKVMKEP